MVFFLKNDWLFCNARFIMNLGKRLCSACTCRYWISALPRVVNLGDFLFFAKLFYLYITFPAELLGGAFFPLLMVWSSPLFLLWKFFFQKRVDILRVIAYTINDPNELSLRWPAWRDRRTDPGGPYFFLKLAFFSSYELYFYSLSAIFHHLWNSQLLFLRPLWRLGRSSRCSLLISPRRPARRGVLFWRTHFLQARGVNCMFSFDFSFLRMV